MWRLLLLSIVVGFVMAACQPEEARRDGSGTVDPVDSEVATFDLGSDENTASVSEYVEGTDTSVLPGNGCHELDILFVIDNSASMESVKGNLIYNFPRFVGVLDKYNESKGGTLKFRLGVTTTSVTRDFITTLPNSDFEQPYTTVGDDGVLLGQAECDLAAPWTEGPSARFTDEFSCLAELRTNQAATIEMPLAAMELALGEQSAPGGPNAGFFTPKADALLIVVIITNEEDCSIVDGGRLMFNGAGMCDDEGSEGLYTPESVKEFLDTLTGGEGRSFLLAIAGPGPGKCESIFGQAWDAIRLRKTVEALGDYAMFGSLCEDDLWLSLEAALGSITATCDDMPPIV